MATGLPDYYSRSYVDIENQTITNLAVDVAKQSLANLDININKQTVTELAIDIAKQTAENLNVNINEQTVSELAVDIAKQTVDNLAVDIGSQSIDTLAIDINKQTIGELSIDIAKQTIGQILQRPIYGSAKKEMVYESYDTTGARTLIDISGQGKIYGGYIHIFSDNDHFTDKVFLDIDGVEFVDFSFTKMYNYGLFGSPVYGPTLVYYNETGKEATVAFPPDLTFESNYELMYTVNTDNQVSIRAEMYYALI